SALRKALAEHRDAIKTVPGRGYQFTAALEGPVAASRGVIAGAPAAMTNLPAPRTPLIGRERETREIAERISAQRLVTLIGPGGIGKTRLALEAARSVQARFPDGVWVAELAMVSDAALVPAAVATALGVAFSVGAVSPERVAQGLAGK